MAVYTSKDTIDAVAPDDLYDSLIITCVEKEFGLNKKSNNPQIISKWEIAGIKNKQNGIDRELKRGDKIYVIAGLSVMPVYFTLTKKAIRFYKEFWLKATGKPESEFMVNDENPDLSIFDKLYMSAVVKMVITDKTKPLSDEQREVLEAAGLPVKGETVTDDEGNPLKNKFLQVDTWNRRFSGDVPAF